MIKAGDKFTVNDLRHDMHVVCDYDMVRYLDRWAPMMGLAVGERLIHLLDYTPDTYADLCRQEWGDVPSSAADLDRQLRDRGFRTTYRFAHEYRTGGLTQDQILHDAYCLEWFCMMEKLATPRACTEDEYLDHMDAAFHLTYYYAQYLWAMNPRVCGPVATALACPNVLQWEQIIGAILGVGYGFHPADVYEYAIKHIDPAMPQDAWKKRYAEQMAFKNAMQKTYNIDTGCLVFCPKNRDTLCRIVTRRTPPYWAQVLRQFLTLGRE